ncbi:MAG: diadenylate cyclase [Acidimicrobiales bacterium]
MAEPHEPSPARLRRLVEELAEIGFAFSGSDEWREMLLVELDYALRPAVHERRVPSFGCIIEPTTDRSRWGPATQLTITGRHLGEAPLSGGRRFADGLSSWLVRRLEGPDELAVFDRPAGSERDLLVLAEALGATLVQRHPVGAIRAVGEFGVLRWDGLTWHHEPPISTWIDSVGACSLHGDQQVLETILEFAVHDLGSRGIGAILVYQPDDPPEPTFEIRLPAPPPLQISRPADLAPLRHVLAQVDGAAVLDATGTLRQLGVRLVPSAEAEADVAGFRGMRHTAGRRYSFDDATATVVVVSEDGPVTVLRRGELLGSSANPADPVLAPE